MNGYNFTERVRKVLAMAREEAARLHHEYVGTEHILLGLIREGEGVAATVLQNLSVDLNSLQETVESTIKKGDPGRRAGPDLPYTSRAKKVLELAMSEARELNYSYLGTEHLLLGLLREEKGIAAQVLVHVGVTVETARAEMLRILEVPSPMTNSAHHSGDRFVAYPMRPGSQPLPRFAERLRVVIANAYRVAVERSRTEVTPAHLALALLQHGEGMANAALDRLGLDRETAISAINDLAPMGTAVVSPETALRLDAAAALALEAMEPARQTLGDEFPATQHLLIGLLSATDVERVFSAQGIRRLDLYNTLVLVYG